jgi:DNA (cytosine-5)-methyltransferase 1
LIVDNFAGGGGASLGIEMASWSGPDIAINHDATALGLHAVNHPHCRHMVEDVWAVDPRTITKGRHVALAWFSPDCKHFSKAKGGRPVEQHIRGLAWVVIRWAVSVRPTVIALENVEEFQDWGPLTVDGLPCPARRGRTFDLFVQRLRQAGYAVEWRELRACDYGAPTIRKRLFLVARCDGRPIKWPAPTHGKPGSVEVLAGILKPWRSAAECIDWSIPCPSIFSRDRPLAEKTMARIARGVRRFVIDSANPFIVPASVAETTTSASSVAAFMAQHNEGMVGHPLTSPVSTLTAKGSHQQLVSAFLTKFYGTCADGVDVRQPFPTITAGGGRGGHHVGEVRAFLMKYYGTGGQHQTMSEPMHTSTAKARLGLITVAGIDYQIVDIGMRMLSPRELFRAQGFPEGYVIDRMADGKPVTKTDQIRLCGNSVSPPVAKALLAANFSNETLRHVSPQRLSKTREAA